MNDYDKIEYICIGTYYIVENIVYIGDCFIYLYRYVHRKRDLHTNICKLLC